jgi:curved DNA-binding protein CbpA
LSAKPDFYRLLHVQPDAPLAVIRSSYRTLMQRLKAHPDLGGSHEQAALLNEAYAVLRDPARRRAYDAGRAEPLGGWPSESAAGTRSRPLCPFCRAAQAPGTRVAPDDACARCGSPLFPAERYRNQPSGQRMTDRFPREHPVTFYEHWPEARGEAPEMRDLSLNGLRLVAARRIEPGTLLKIECGLFSALARVAYAQAEHGARRWTLGAEFVTLRFARTAGRFVSAHI